jgi:dCMP deaminase
MRNRFLAYVPAINKQYLDWLNSGQGFSIEIVPGDIRKKLLPRLERNIIGIPDDQIIELLRSIFPDREVIFFNPDNISEDSFYHLPDDDLSTLIKESYLKGIPTKSYCIFARWDMTAVKARQPVIPDCQISTEKFDLDILSKINQNSKSSPDWWRQIGVMVFKNHQLLVSGYNRHYPTEYESVIFGDPRLNFDAGDPNASEIYISLHAERLAISLCAKKGISINGASMYINTFPCGDCARWIAEAGISKLYFREGSSFLKGFDVLRAYEVEIVQIITPE